MSIKSATQFIRDWDTVDIYKLREMLLGAQKVCDRAGCRLDEHLDLNDLPTAFAVERDRIRGHVVWACDVKRQCLVGPDFDIAPMDELLPRKQNP